MGELYELVHRLARHLIGGLILVLALAWVGVREVLDVVFYDQPIPLLDIEMQTPSWSIDDYGVGDRRVTVTIPYRNRSDLRVSDFTLAMHLEDCTTKGCQTVHDERQDLSLDTAAGLRGRATATFVVWRMAKPEGDLRLSVHLLEATGQADAI